MLDFVCFNSEIHFSNSIKVWIILINFNSIRIIIRNIKKFGDITRATRIPIVAMLKHISSKSITSITEKSFLHLNSWKPNFSLPYYRLINIKVYLVINNFKTSLFLINISINIAFTCTWRINQLTFILRWITWFIKLCHVS